MERKRKQIGLGLGQRHTQTHQEEKYFFIIFHFFNTTNHKFECRVQFGTNLTPTIEKAELYTDLGTIFSAVKDTFS
jgi:hypothetical protein